MFIFDLTLQGFDGDTSDTDHLVKWIKAPSLEIVQQWRKKMGLVRITNEPYDTGFPSHYTPADGVDIILDGTGKMVYGDIVGWREDYEKVLAKASPGYGGDDWQETDEPE